MMPTTSAGVWLPKLTLSESAQMMPPTRPSRERQACYLIGSLAFLSSLRSSSLQLLSEP